MSTTRHPNTFNGIRFQRGEYETSTVRIHVNGSFAYSGGPDSAAGIMMRKFLDDMKENKMFEVEINVEGSSSLFVYHAGLSGWTVDADDVGRHTHWKVAVSMLNCLNS